MHICHASHVSSCVCVFKWFIKNIRPYGLIKKKIQCLLYIVFNKNGKIRIGPIPVCLKQFKLRFSILLYSLFLEQIILYGSIPIGFLLKKYLWMHNTVYSKCTTMCRTHSRIQYTLQPHMYMNVCENAVLCRWTFIWKLFVHCYSTIVDR